MKHKQEIILRHFRDGEAKKKIARELGIDVKTVRRYLREYSEKRSSLDQVEGEEKEVLMSTLTEAPKYNSSTRSRRRLTQEMQDKIEAYLKENVRKRSQGRHKQVMKKVDIHEALKRSGYQIGYTTVCNYIRERERGKREAYIRQHYEPGVVCEFDWGEVKLTIGESERVFQLAVFTPAYSNYRWAYLFERQDMASFQQAHAKFFSHIGGVYGELVYDNMRVVIRRFVGRTEKHPTEGLLRLSMYYQFGFRFCNVGRGNEKGHVERSVEYVRRKAFGRQDCFASRAEANTYLEQRLEELNQSKPWAKEQSAAALLQAEEADLHPCPVVAFECGEWRSLRVDKYSTISLGSNHYSVPEHLVGRMVDVKVYPLLLIVYEEKKQVCRHERQYTLQGWYIQLEHYLSTLRRKPGALAGSVALKQADKRLRGLYESFFKHRPKAFIELLHYQRQKQVELEKLETVIESLSRITPRDISLDKIKVLCERTELSPAPMCEPDAILSHALAQLQAVAQLMPQGDSITPQSVVL